ncbi:hypothetical protein GCM10010191_67640 [Actinomadura vinacea]|uniref:Uncharacterized protein n=1 Tax=Actinomadura vinacea TaxID=115336 RepID=A0ABN3JYT5_9ACTN
MATQSLAEFDMPSSRIMVGSALATTVLSMVIMNALMATTVSAHPYRPRVTCSRGAFRPVLEFAAPPLFVSGLVRSP